MEAQEKLLVDIQQFLNVYRALLPESKAQLEAQLGGVLKNQDEKTKLLYQTILKAAKDGREAEETIELLHHARLRQVSA